MTTAPRARGRWVHRFAIHALTVVLGLLVFWALGFLVSDIRSLPGPSWVEIETRHLDAGQVTELERLRQQSAELHERQARLAERQRVLSDSARNLQQTIGQLSQLRAPAAEGTGLGERERATLQEALALFLDTQRDYQQLSREIAGLLEQRQELEARQQALEQALERQREPARAEFAHLQTRHDLTLAAYQLAFLLPLLAFAVVLMLRRRGSIYFPLFLAFGAAALVKVAQVVHWHFPARYVNYVLVALLLLAVGRLLIHFIRMTAFPEVQRLLRQYREAYERFLCPVCEYPIRTGPRRFLYWTRRTVNRIVVPAGEETAQEPYTCPACGTRLFEECPSCHQTRHALLPHCAHCGAEKPLDPPG